MYFARNGYSSRGCIFARKVESSVFSLHKRSTAVSSSRYFVLLQSGAVGIFFKEENRTEQNGQASVVLTNSTNRQPF